MNPKLEAKIFPEWLRNRADFQSQYLSCVSFDLIDKFQICTKAPHKRNRFEKESLIAWAQSVPDIAWISKGRLSEVCDKLTSVSFNEGEVLFKKYDTADCLLLILDGVIEVWDDGRKVSVVSKNNAIGEASLKTNTLRSATCIASTPVKALRLSKLNYDTIVLREKLQETREVATFFKSTPFFKFWSFNRLERLADYTLVKQVEAFQEIYKQGDQSVNFYVVKTGKVHLEVTVKVSTVVRWPRGLREWEEHTNVNEVKKLVKVCGPGDLFGENEVGLGVPMKTSATTQEHSVIFIVMKDVHKNVFRKNELRMLATLNPCRPDTADLEEEIKVMKTNLHRKSKALLDAFETNLTPTGRDCFSNKKSRMLKRMLSGKKDH